MKPKLKLTTPAINISLISLIILIISPLHSSANEPPPVLERGPHHRILKITKETPVTHPSTDPSIPPPPPLPDRATVETVTELQAGLHRWTDDRGWVETHPRLEPFQGGAIARNLQYTFTIAPNLATPNAFEVALPQLSQLPEGSPLLSGHLFGLVLTDGNQSVLIAEIQDCAGIIGGPDQNEITFDRAFTDFDISVKYVTARDRLSQILILHQQLPHPREWGLTDNAVLEILTEFTAFPELRREPRPPIDGLAGEHLSFPTMEFLPGRAFTQSPAPPDVVAADVRSLNLSGAVGAHNGAHPNAIPIVKTMEHFEGNRWFLIEKVPWKAIAPELAKLPPVANTWRKKHRPLMARTSSVGRDAAPPASALPPVPRHGNAPPAASVSSLKPIPFAAPKLSEGGSTQSTPYPIILSPLPSTSPATNVASVETPRVVPRHGNGFVLDWELVTTIHSNLWARDTTYYIAGPVTIKTNIFEGGTVIKFAPTNNAGITITGPLTYGASAEAPWHGNAPIILTARDDHSVGAQIGSAPLTGKYAAKALELDSYTSGLWYDVSDIRISHAALGIAFFQGHGNSQGEVHLARNLQLVNCREGVQAYHSTFKILNGLFHNVAIAFAGSGSGTATGNVQHLTVNQCSNLNSGTLTLYATNSLFVAVTNLTSFIGAYNGTNNDPGTTLQTVGAGANYLANASPFRNAGTTNIEPVLRTALAGLTTHPPIIAGHLTVLGNINLTLNPQAGRDSDTPDLGWHYSPIDYAFGGAYLTNSTITVNPGTTIALYSPTNASGNYYGIMLSDGARLFSDGNANNLNRIVRYNTVQEQSQTTWNTAPVEHIASDAADVSDTPETRFRFTTWLIPASDTCHFRGYSGTDLVAAFRDCQFSGGKFKTDRPTVNVTNCLFDRTAVILEGLDYALDGSFQNTLFYGGSLYVNQEMGGAFAFKDNLFDQVTITQLASLTHDYSGYITNSIAHSITNSGTHNLFTNTLIYQIGSLGGFYQPTNSLFLDVGSTNANLLGFYHYTVLTNNLKETNSMIDIGFHYVATDNSRNPLDADSDSLPDYLEDTNGSGHVDSGETDWRSGGDGGLRVVITRPKSGSILP